MESCLEIKFMDILKRTLFFRRKGKSVKNVYETKHFGKVNKFKKEISGTSYIKKPSNGYAIRKTKNQSSINYKDKPGVNDTNNINEEHSDSNSDDEYNIDERKIEVKDFCCIKEFTGFCDWFVNSVTEENCVLPEDLAVYNELKKEGKVLELDDTWRMYFEQPRDVRMLLENPDLINDAEEAQDLKDLDYIRNQLRCELQNVGQAIADMRRKRSHAECQLSEHVKQCLSTCKLGSTSLEQLINEISSMRETLQCLVRDPDNSIIDSTSEDSTFNVTSTSCKFDLEKSQNCKQGKVPQQKYIFQVGLQKYETACLLFQSSLDALFNDFGHDVDDMLCSAGYGGTEDYKCHIPENSDFHEFCRLQSCLPKTMSEYARLASEEAALTAVIEKLQSLKKTAKKGNFELSSVEIRTNFETRELSDLKSEGEAVFDELCQVYEEWVRSLIESAVFDTKFSKLLAAGVNDLTLERLLDAMLKVKATGDMLISLSLIDVNCISAAIKLIIDTEDSLAKNIPSLQKCKDLMEYNCLDTDRYKNSELIKGIVDMLGCNDTEIENTMRTLSSSTCDSLKTVASVLSDQYNALCDMESQLNKWCISVCDHPVWKSLEFDVVNGINVFQSQITESQSRLEKLTKSLYESQETITQSEENRTKRLKWISFLLEAERKKYD